MRARRHRILGLTCGRTGRGRLIEVRAGIPSEPVNASETLLGIN